MREKDKKKYAELSDEQTVEMYQQGDKKALDYLLFKYGGYIKKIAVYYYNKTNLENEDILSYANIGFMEGVSRYDVNRDGYFMYFSRLWAKTKILLAIDNYNLLIRQPVNRLKDLKKLNMFLTSFNGSTYSMEEIIEATGFSRLKIQEYFLSKNYLKRKQSDSSSFSYTQESNTDIYTMVITEQNKVYKIFHDQDLINSVEKLLDRFDNIEKYILIHSFGLFENIKMDNTEIGECLNVSSERVRQIKDKCIRRFRHSSFTCVLQQYLD